MENHYKWRAPVQVGMLIYQRVEINFPLLELYIVFACIVIVFQLGIEKLENTGQSSARQIKHDVNETSRVTKV